MKWLWILALAVSCGLKQAPEPQTPQYRTMEEDTGILNDLNFDDLPEAAQEPSDTGLKE